MAALYKRRLKIGSCAMEVCELCQVGNKAALSRNFHVPQGRLVLAGCAGNAWQFP